MADRAPRGTHVEIERKFLLRSVPPLPASATAVRIEQGYLAPPDFGRLRKSTYPDGTVRHTSTVKRGRGLVRSEQERDLSVEEFRRQWPRTDGARLRKTRYRVPVDQLVWEIDVYDDLPLVVAEVELPYVDTPAPPPSWLMPYMVREITEDASYTNRALAERLRAMRGG